jgi:hypothetical protein
LLFKDVVMLQIEDHRNNCKETGCLKICSQAVARLDFPAPSRCGVLPGPQPVAGPRTERKKFTFRLK